METKGIPMHGIEISRGKPERMKGLVWRLPGAGHPEEIFGDGRGKVVNLNGVAFNQVQPI